MSSYKAYEDLGELGKGSYGDIVAIKCFLTDSSKDYTTVKRTVLVEASALRELRHENVVQLFHIFMENSIFYMVFEFVDRTLLEIIQDAPKKCLGCGFRVKSFAFQLFRALAYIHSRNFVHRDIKPENILITRDDVLKVADFGFATKIAYAGQRYSTYIATRWYRAPELLSGDIFYGKGVDVWAAGAVLVEMILGHPMAAGTEDSEQMSKTIALVGRIPKYMMERVKKLYEGFSDQKSDMPQFTGLGDLLAGQPVAYVAFICLCLEPDPLIRSTADSLLSNPLFTLDDRYFIANLITEIKQCTVQSGRLSALSYQKFLKKREVYKRAVRDFSGSGTPSVSAVVSKYLQLGLEDRVLRTMADIIVRERKTVPDFSWQNSDVCNIQFQERGDRPVGNRESALTMPTTNRPIGNYFHSAFSPSAAPKPLACQGLAGLCYASPSFQPADALARSYRPLESTRSEQMPGKNPWDYFSVKKTFPVVRGEPSSQQKLFRMKSGWAADRGNKGNNQDEVAGNAPSQCGPKMWNSRGKQLSSVSDQTCDFSKHFRSEGQPRWKLRDDPSIFPACKENFSSESESSCNVFSELSVSKLAENTNTGSVQPGAKFTFKNKWNFGPADSGSPFYNNVE